MFRVKTLAVAAALTFGYLGGALSVAPAFAEAQVRMDPAKQADIQKLMNLTGAGNLGMQAMDQMILSMKGAMASVPEKFWTEFRKEVNADELVNPHHPGLRQAPVARRDQGAHQVLRDPGGQKDDLGDAGDHRRVDAGRPAVGG